MKKIALHKTYITFGQDHVHRVNNVIVDKDCVGIIESENAVRGREIAFELFGPKFSMEYPEQYWEEDSMKFFPRGYIKLI